MTIDDFDDGYEDDFDGGYEDDSEEDFDDNDDDDLGKEDDYEEYSNHPDDDPLDGYPLDEWEEMAFLGAMAEELADALWSQYQERRNKFGDFGNNKRLDDQIGTGVSKGGCVPEYSDEEIDMHIQLQKKNESANFDSNEIYSAKFLSREMEECDLKSSEVDNVEIQEERFDHNNFQEIYERAGAFFHNGELNEAFDCYCELIKADPHNQTRTIPDVYYYRGLIYYEKDQIMEAWAEFEEAVRIEPDFVDALCARSETNIILGSISMAFEDLEKVFYFMSNENSIVEAYCIRGFAFLKMKDFDRAFEGLDKAIDYDYCHDKAFFYKGLANLQIGKLNEAISDMAESTFKYIAHPEFEFPRSSYRYYFLGRAYHLKNELDLAVQQYSKAIKIKPTLSNPYFMRGIIYFKFDKLEDSLSDFNKAIELGTEVSESIAYYCRFVVLMSLGRNNEAIENLKKIIKAGYSDTQLFFDLDRVFDYFGKNL